jgi:uncharacterized protein (DUF2236 family)
MEFTESRSVPLVHASLVHGVYTRQNLLGRAWRPGEVEQFYLEMRQVGRLYGVREQDMPADWAEFCSWFDEMSAAKLTRSDVTDRVLAVVGSPKPPPVPLLRNEFCVELHRAARRRTGAHRDHRRSSAARTA